VVISIAELIDNSLSATKHNDGLRLIEIRFYDNDKDSMVVIIDNGKGMNRKQLNDWAKFKYSKFDRKQEEEESQTQDLLAPTFFFEVPCPCLQQISQRDESKEISG